MPRLGEATAMVGIVEFTDYQCPFCKRFHDQTFSKLKAQYIDTGKIQYIIRDFPLAFHGQAKPAAVAAHCAQAQGDYWTMHHELGDSGFDGDRLCMRNLRPAKG